ncbi:hypothetical protein Rruber_05464 (plasmid) [Rhodococcus ruber]|uniref:hypothetical protein n=1 Tax=Rhodococcus ruber TaxID=1830 RepID=UPI00315C5C0C
MPLDRYGHDQRVAAVMVELRRDTYRPGHGHQPGPDAVAQLGTYLAALVDAAAEADTDV